MRDPHMCTAARNPGKRAPIREGKPDVGSGNTPRFALIGFYWVVVPTRVAHHTHTAAAALLGPVDILNFKFRDPPLAVDSNCQSNLRNFSTTKLNYIPVGLSVQKEVILIWKLSLGARRSR